MINIGISVTSAYQIEDVREGPRRMVDRVRAARGAGLDSLFLGDHHAVRAPYYQNTPMLGRLLAEWSDKPAGALFLLPLWNPVLVAEQTATLACIATGKFIMQCALGNSSEQFAAMGTDIRFRPSAFEQSLDTIRQLWAGETVNLSGHWAIKDAHISPLPPEPVDIWVGAAAPVAIDRAARIGDAWIAEPGATLEQAKHALGHYTTALARHGKPAPQAIAIRRDIHVAGSPEDAAETRATIEAQGYRGIDPAALMIGTAGEVAGMIQAVSALGFTDIIIRNLHPDPKQAVESTTRLGEVKTLLQS